MFILQWLEGLRRLGHEVLYHDYADGRPETTALFGEIMERCWDPALSALVLPSGRAAFGLDAKQVEKFGRDSVALISLGCTFRADPEPWLADICPRILIEQDPGFSHVWASASSPDEIFGRHDLYFTVGANIGTPRCSIPTFGLDWQHVWNPVVIDWWDPAKRSKPDRFTTIAGWWGNAYQEFQGQIWGPKAEQMRKFMGLPELVEEPLEIALDTSTNDPEIEQLQKHGWIVRSPALVSSDPVAYRDYVQGSAGEFSCAKGLYVGTRCGWFSDRSECYLAAGRPVILQDTGFKDVLPTGEGLFSVSTVEEAAEAIRAIRGDYVRHAQAAHNLAIANFDSQRVLPTLLNSIGI